MLAVITSCIVLCIMTSPGASVIDLDEIANDDDLNAALFEIEVALAQNDCPDTDDSSSVASNPREPDADPIDARPTARKSAAHDMRDCRRSPPWRTTRSRSPLRQPPPPRGRSSVPKPVGCPYPIKGPPAARPASRAPRPPSTPPPLAKDGSLQPRWVPPPPPMKARPSNYERDDRSHDVHMAKADAPATPTDHQPTHPPTQPTHAPR